MKQIIVTLAALLALAAVSTASNHTQCSASGASNIIISLSTKRNATGHWNIAVDVNKKAQRLLVNNDDQGVALTVGQTTSFCDLTDSVHLFATATVSAPTSTPTLTPMPTPTSTPTPKPPPNYELMLGLGYYRMSASALEWEDARRACEAEGAHLLIINSEMEAKVVREFFARPHDYSNQSSTEYVFVGFRREEKLGNFITVLGSLLEKTGYIKWVDRYPLKENTFNCGFANSKAEFINNPCRARVAYICEFQH